MKYKILLQKPRDRFLLLVFLSSFLLAIIFIFLFQIILTQFPAGAGLMEMKNSWNKSNMDKIIAIWNSDSLNKYVDLMIMVHIIDLGFMAVYGIAVFTGLLIVARKLTDSEKLQNFYLNLSLISWLSVIFDLFEEIFILNMLFNPLNISESSAFAASLAAMLCVIVLYSCIGLFLIGLLLVLIQNRKK